MAAILALAACGLRTDPDSALICVEEDDGSTDTGTAPTAGSCEAPIPLPWVAATVRGQLGGCGAAEGWCGGSGGEDVYRLEALPNAIDVRIEFDPGGTDIDPVFRVLRVPAGSTFNPCEVEDEPICTPITTGDAVHNLFVKPEYDHYLIVDSHAGDAGRYEFRMELGVAMAAETCLSSVVEDPTTPTSLNPGDSFVINGFLEAEQGHYEGFCDAPGDEDIYRLQLSGAGTLRAAVTSWSGSAPAVLAINSTCAGNLERSCNTADISTTEIVENFGGPTTILLVVDQAGVNGSNYTLTVDY